MSQEAKQQRDDLLDSYEAAIVAFNAASSSLILQLAANSRPTDEELASEQDACAAVVTARLELCAAYDPPTSGHPILRRC